MVHKLPTPHVHTNTQSENATGPRKSAKIQFLYIRVQYIYTVLLDYYAINGGFCRYWPDLHPWPLGPFPRVPARHPSAASRAISPCTGPTSLNVLGPREQQPRYKKIPNPSLILLAGTEFLALPISPSLTSLQQRYKIGPMLPFLIPPILPLP